MDLQAVIAALEAAGMKVVADDETQDATETTKAKAQRVVVPSHVVKLNDNRRITLSQCYGTKSGVKFSSHGGYRIHVDATNGGKSDGMSPANLTAEVITAIRDLPDEVVAALITDARVTS